MTEAFVRMPRMHGKVHSWRLRRWENQEKLGDSDRFHLLGPFPFPDDDVPAHVCKCLTMYSFNHIYRSLSRMFGWLTDQPWHVHPIMISAIARNYLGTRSGRQIRGTMDAHCCSLRPKKITYNIIVGIYTLTEDCSYTSFTTSRYLANN